MIKGNVARIISQEEVVLNIGKNDGVKEGMEFVIYENSDRIIDPETGEDLGPLEIIKGRVKTFHVQEKISRAKTITYQISQTANALQTIQGALSRPITRQEKLKVRDEDKRPLENVNTVVSVGDKVHSV